MLGEKGMLGRVFLLGVICCLFALKVNTVWGKAKEKKSRPATNQRVDINMTTHRLTFYQGSRVFMALPISGGGEYWYTWYEKRGKRRIKHRSKAHTPRGSFRVYNKIAGRHMSGKGLGSMYYPVYFTGGIAIHGGYVPRKHVSHGCVRIPMRSARRFYRLVQYGAVVNVR